MNDESCLLDLLLLCEKFGDKEGGTGGTAPYPSNLVPEGPVVERRRTGSFERIHVGSNVGLRNVPRSVSHHLRVLDTDKIKTNENKVGNTSIVYGQLF